MKLLPLLGLTLLATGCQSMSEGILSIEGRAIVLDDQTADTPFEGVTTDDVDVEAYGAHVALSTPIVDLLGGVDFREFGDEDATELTLGARRRFLEVLRFHPYVEANMRFSIDELETADADGDNYFGWNAGGGFLLDLTESLFLNFRVVYETTDVDGNDIDGLLGTVGIGFSL